LHRLEHLGLVSGSLSVFSGRTRRTYSITPQGRDRLTADWKAWEEFTATVTALIDSRRAGNH
jgi:DNA-binding PadR family transcriptional regulator